MSNLVEFKAARVGPTQKALIDAVLAYLTSGGLASSMFHVEREKTTMAFDQDAGLDRIDVLATGRITGQKMRVSFWIKDGKVLTSQTMVAVDTPDFSKVKRAWCESTRV